jgi:predicted  nucleic acid-binding Zn-ribbon protein
LKLDHHAALDVIADLRRKIDTSKIDSDPELKSGRSAVEGIERALKRKRKSLAALNTKVANAQGNLANANKKLQQAQAADQKDSNKKKKD